ncbi:hypothetical protein DV735_g3423, partial [Chaetothyriales sp. CBS 134920]
MNFCEEDHVVTFAIAEFINTVSNLAYIYFALVLLGLSSGVYHATLKHYNQIWDETGMYLLVASMDWYIYSFPGAVFSGRVAKPVYTLVLWGSCAAVVVLNFLDTRGADFGLHTILFIALLSALWPRTLWLISERRRLERDGLLAPGAVSLRALRHRVGLPLAWLLECHGWWHVLTAVGAGVFVDLTNLFSSPTQGNVIVSQGGGGNPQQVNGDDVKLETKTD